MSYIIPYFNYNASDTNKLYYLPGSIQDFFLFFFKKPSIACVQGPYKTAHSIINGGLFFFFLHILTTERFDINSQFVFFQAKPLLWHELKLKPPSHLSPLLPPMLGVDSEHIYLPRSANAILISYLCLLPMLLDTLLYLNLCELKTAVSPPKKTSFNILEVL